MSFRYLARCAAFLLVSGTAAGAQRYTIRGNVVADDDREPVAGAVIFATERPDAPVRTNSAGAFGISVDRLPARLIASRIGHSPDTVLIEDPARVVRFTLRRAPLALSPSVIAAERGYSAASSSSIRSFDIQLRPRGSSQELLRLAPGLVIAQHAGGGKAEQLYLRGFDADHGTDVAISVDGVPVNMVTHAHGQGYADLHWLMPEVVGAVDIRKGPFDVRDGDFATAGSVSFQTVDRVDSRFIMRAGAYGLRQGMLLAPFGGGAGDAGGYLAGSVLRNDGPFLNPQRHTRLNAFGKLTAPLGDSELLVTASAFDATWEASGQVPDRAVRSGVISRFGAIDASEGGSTSRYDISLGVRGVAWEARVFATKYDFDLFSNFTFFLADSLNGDGIEQVDDRVLLGAFTSLQGRALGRGVWSTGSGFRADDGDVALRSQRQRTRLSTRVDVRNRQLQLFQWARLETALSPRLNADVGVRADLFRFAVTDRRAGGMADFPHGSRTRWQGIVSPRVNLAFSASRSTQLFANAGTGFHSNDARDAVLARPNDNVLPRAVSGELGTRRSWTGGTLGAALWWLDLESETVFVGDEGTTEASGRTRRVGLDLELRQQLARTLWLDADVNLARGRFRDEAVDADRIPLAPTRTATAGLTSRREKNESGVRVRHIASRAANEDNSVRALGSTIWELFGAWNLGALKVMVTVDNMFNVKWNEAQFATTSRLRHEPAPITELHYTPGAPRAFSLGIEWRY